MEGVGQIFLWENQNSPPAPFKHCSMALPASVLLLPAASGNLQSSFKQLSMSLGYNPYSVPFTLKSDSTNSLSLVLIYLQTLPCQHQTAVGFTNREIQYIQPGCLPTAEVSKQA